MSVDSFRNKPTGEHKAYERSIFDPVAPEDVTCEVLLGSAYRKLVLAYRDSQVDLNDIEKLPTMIPASKEWGSPGMWSLLLQQGALGSPRRGLQRSEKRQLMPIVPEIARYACVLGTLRQRWFPGNLLLQAIGAGYGKSKGEQLAKSFGEALRVEKSDDLFARFVARGLDAVQPLPDPFPYTSTGLEDYQVVAFRDVDVATSVSQLTPAEQLCKDLEAAIALKNWLTRRQWTVLIEALLRLGLGMHLLWTCQMSYKCWKLVLSVAGGAPVLSEMQIEEALWLSHQETGSLLEVGRDAVPLIKQLILHHLTARFGLNLLLNRLDDQGCSWSPNQVIGYSPKSVRSAPATIRMFLQHISDNRDSIDGTDPTNWLHTNCTDILNSEVDLIRFTSGFTLNWLYAIQYGMGRIITKEPEQRAYDQSYLLTNNPKKGRGQSTWPVQPGPAMLIFMVYACCRAQGKGIPASLEDFRTYLGDYGLYTPADELLGGKIGEDLGNLGLMVDSPDAAGGRLLVNPFGDLEPTTN